MEFRTVKEMTMEKLFRQIGDEVVEFTDKEYEQYEIDKVESAMKQADAEAKATARQAILDRLGITADEAAILLG
jgi:hypothetical protein